MKLTVKQRPANGFMGGSKQVNFMLCHNSANYELAVEQLGERTITITSSDTHSYENILGVYYALETLLMLFDGHFYPVASAFENETEITHSWKQRELPSYHSADFVLGTENRLLDFESVLNEQILDRWITLRDELDMNFKMVLYCLSDVQIPVDMKCAFMIEAFLGICELVSMKRNDFPLPAVPKKPKQESKLKYYFSAVADKYGNSIFEEKYKRDKMKFAQILVNSRNRIGHIRSPQDRVYLDGGESVMYLMKLSLLYRVVLFDLLGIDKHTYEGNLEKRVQAINAHDVMKNFLKKSGEQNG